MDTEAAALPRYLAGAAGAGTGDSATPSLSARYLGTAEMPLTAAVSETAAAPASPAALPHFPSLAPRFSLGPDPGRDPAFPQPELVPGGGVTLPPAPPLRLASPLPEPPLLRRSFGVDADAKTQVPTHPARAPAAYDTARADPVESTQAQGRRGTAPAADMGGPATDAGAAPATASRAAAAAPAEVAPAQPQSAPSANRPLAAQTADAADAVGATMPAHSTPATTETAPVAPPDRILPSPAATTAAADGAGSSAPGPDTARADDPAAPDASGGTQGPVQVSAEAAPGPDAQTPLGAADADADDVGDGDVEGRAAGLGPDAQADGSAQSAAAGTSDTGAGPGAAMSQFRAQVRERAQSMPTPRIPAGGGAPVRRAAQRRREHIRFTEQRLPADAQAQVPAAPDQMPSAPGTLMDPVPGARRRVEATGGRTLADVHFGTLSKTPLGNQPRLGDRPLSARRLRALHHLPAGPEGRKPDRQTRQVLQLRERLLHPPAVPEGSRGAQVLAQQPVQAVPTPTPAARTQLAQVFARLLARPEREAEDLMDRARRAAFPGGALQRELPEYGNDPHAGNLARALMTQYRDIAAQAGVAAADLDRELNERRRVLAQQERAARTAVGGASTDARTDLERAHAGRDATVSREARRIRAQADAVADAAGGDDTPDIEAQRERLIVDITRRAAAIDAGYRQALSEREQALDDAEQQRVDAYRAAVQKDEFQLQARASLPPDRMAVLRAAYRSRSGGAPAGSSGLSDVEAATLMAASRRWGDARAVAVRGRVRSHKQRAQSAVGAWRKATREAADAAREEIRSWADSQTGTTRSWWDRLWDWARDWVAQARANAEAWQTRLNQQHAAEVVTDLNLIDRLSRAADHGITAAQERELRSLSGDQARIVQEFFGAGQAERRVDPIALVARLMRARIWNERRADLVQRLEETFLADDSLSYATIDRVVGRAVSGLTAQLHAAFHGNWGILSEAGTDEAAVFAALNGLNRVQSLALRNIYRRRYGEALENELRSELSGGELRRAQALLQGNPAEAAAATIYTAMHETFLGTGAGTDEAAIQQTLRGLSAQERADVERIYRERFGRDLRADLRGELDDWASGSDRESRRALATLDGNLELADSLEIEEELQGSWFHSSTTTTVASVYERVRREVQQQAQREQRDSAWVEAEIARRTGGIRHAYDTRNAAAGRSLESDIVAGTRAERMFWGSTQANREASRDYLNALASNDMRAADAARIRIERTSLSYASDSTITATLGSQYDRALTQQRLDYAPERRRELMRGLNERERASGRVWTAAERWAAQQEIERRIEREMIQRARAVAQRNTAGLEREYAASYGEPLRDAVVESTSFTDERMALLQLRQGGYLTPYQRFELATDRWNTDEDAAKRAFAGLTRAEIAQLDARWRREHGGESLLQRARGTISGRDLLDVEIALDGTPETIDQQIAQMRRRVAFEEPTNAIGALLAPTERQVMRDQLAHMEAMAARMHDPPAGSTPAEQRRARDALIAEFETQRQLVEASIEHHRRRSDALADSITMAVGIVVAVVVGVVGSFFTAGAAGAVALAVIASLASTAATIGTRAVLKGNAYGREDLMVDIGVGIVDAVVAALTAGLGDKLLGLAAPAGQAAVRNATANGLRGAWQQAMLGIERGAARLGSQGLVTRGVRPAGFLSRMAAEEASLLSRGAARVMAETTESFVQSLPSSVVAVAADDRTWQGPGSPAWNLIANTAQAMGPGLMLGLAAGRATSALGSAGGLLRRPRLGLDADLTLPQRPRPGTPEYRARLEAWQARHPGRPEADFEVHLEREFQRAADAVQAQQQVRRDVRGHLENALPPADRAIAGEVPVSVVSDLEFRRLNDWRAGDATLVVQDGQVHIVVREGAPPGAVRAQLEVQVPRLRELVEPGTGGRVRDPAAALPRDLRGRLPMDIDPDLPPRTVRVEHDPVPRLVVGRGARAADIQLHLDTARNVLQLHGAYGRVRKLLDRLADWVFLHGEPPPGTRAWEARQELRKLDGIVDARLREGTRPDLTPHQRVELDADIAHLREQIAMHERTLADMDLSPARGYIAAEGRPTPTRAEMLSAHDAWVEQMQRFIRGDGPPPPPWRGPEPRFDERGTWRGHHPAAAYAAYRKALDDTHGLFEVSIARDRMTGEYFVMVGGDVYIRAPADAPGRSWEVIMHNHPNRADVPYYAVPSRADFAVAERANVSNLQHSLNPHVAFVETVLNGRRVRMAYGIDQQGYWLHVSADAPGRTGLAGRKGELLRFRTLHAYEQWSLNLPAAQPPQGTRWMPRGSQAYRDAMREAADALTPIDPTNRLIRQGWDRISPEINPAAQHTAGRTAPPETPTRQQPAQKARTGRAPVRQPGAGGEPAAPQPARAQLDAQHRRWMTQMRSFIRGEGPPPPRTGPQPQLDAHGTWRGFDPREAYAAYRRAVDEGHGMLEANLARDRESGEYFVMLGAPGSVKAPADVPGRSWEPILHNHPNQEGGLRYTLPSDQDFGVAMFATGANREHGLPAHVAFVESQYAGRTTRVAYGQDEAGRFLEIGPGHPDHAGRGAEALRFRSQEAYLAWYHQHEAGTPPPEGTRWLPPHSQAWRSAMTHAAAHLSLRFPGHGKVRARIEADAPEHKAGAPPPRRQASHTPVRQLGGDAHARSQLRTDADMPGAKPDTEPAPVGPVAKTKTIDATGEIHTLTLLSDGRIIRCSQACMDLSRNIGLRAETYFGTNGSCQLTDAERGRLRALQRDAEQLYRMAREAIRARADGREPPIADAELLALAGVLEGRMVALEQTLPPPRVQVPTRAPLHWPVREVDYTTLQRDLGNNIEPLPHGVVYEFPDGHRVWRDGDAIVHESWVAPAHGRQGFEQELYTAGKTELVHLDGMHRAHSLGQGTGFESPFGIYYAPAEVNLTIQNNGIEAMLRALRDAALPGETFHVRTRTTPHPQTLRLKEIRYEVSVSRGGGQPDLLFEYRIEVSAEPPFRVSHGVADITEVPRNAQYFDLVDVPARLRAFFRSGSGRTLELPPVSPAANYDEVHPLLGEHISTVTLPPGYRRPYQRNGRWILTREDARDDLYEPLTVDRDGRIQLVRNVQSD